eukprot:TRINITY_DN6499_c0_g3_i1.p1 TRINITY_DN6499_c0_g3~~TRINITY_DN6499_c0_g3_i1.p1  ORF type:complete len:493 (-),score=83.58 TRINITY_DN6499_c0_g3_i1:16-1494(-)
MSRETLKPGQTSSTVIKLLLFKILLITAMFAVGLTLHTTIDHVQKGSIGTRYLMSFQQESEGGNETQQTNHTFDFLNGDVCDSAFEVNGGFVVYMIGVCFMFLGLAVICEGEFKDVLSTIADKMNMELDVVGASFMAAGSSSPELFMSFVAIFRPRDDIGASTIIGSAIFNILVIIGTSAIFSGGKVFDISWKAILRDSFINVIAVIYLVVVFIDEQIVWYEAVIGIVLYALYLVLLKFNRSLTSKMDLLNCCGCFPDVVEQDYIPSISGDEEEKKHIILSTDFSNEDEMSISFHHEEKESLVSKIFHVIVFPFEKLFHYTIPSSKHSKFKYMFVVSFFICLMWMAFLTWLMTLMTTKLGCVFKVHEAIMGLTVLAIGTSMPDCLSSIYVARSGKGSMAVSNALGSNIFDILLALGLPWLFSLAIGKEVRVESDDMEVYISIMLACLILLIISFQITGWKLHLKMGLILFILYSILLTVAIVYEIIRPTPGT